MSTESDVTSGDVTSEIPEAPVDDVAVEDGQGGVEDVATPEHTVLDLSEFDGHVVQIGDDFVPVAELQGGWLRQSDYSRKSQELAAT